MTGSGLFKLSLLVLQNLDDDSARELQWPIFLPQDTGKVRLLATFVSARSVAWARAQRPNSKASFLLPSVSELADLHSDSQRFVSFNNTSVFCLVSSNGAAGFATSAQ